MVEAIYPPLVLDTARSIYSHTSQFNPFGKLQSHKCHRIFYRAEGPYDLRKSSALASAYNRLVTLSAGQGRI
jgi:hypothetical protein